MTMDVVGGVHFIAMQHVEGKGDPGSWLAGARWSWEERLADRFCR